MPLRLRAATFAALLATLVAVRATDLDWGWRTASLDELPNGVAPVNPEHPQEPLKQVRVQEVDVDGDGVQDLLVDTCYSSSHSRGSYVFVYCKRGSTYKQLLLEQATQVYVLPQKQGPPRLACWAKSTVADAQCIIYRFEGGRLRKLFTEIMKLQNGELRVIKTIRNHR